MGDQRYQKVIDLCRDPIKLLLQVRHTEAAIARIIYLPKNINLASSNTNNKLNDFFNKSLCISDLEN
jgi:hypothetical protein